MALDYPEVRGEINLPLTAGITGSDLIYLFLGELGG
jgi:hypothetical protein